jgi:hypothetical protein
MRLVRLEEGLGIELLKELIESHGLPPADFLKESMRVGEPKRGYRLDAGELSRFALRTYFVFVRHPTGPQRCS